MTPVFVLGTVEERDMIDMADDPVELGIVVYRQLNKICRKLSPGLAR